MREREREKGRERENITASFAPVGDGACKQGMCSDQESNQQPFGYGTALQPAEPRQTGPLLSFKFSFDTFLSKISIVI